MDEQNMNTSPDTAAQPNPQSSESQPVAQPAPQPMQAQATTPVVEPVVPAQPIQPADSMPMSASGVVYGSFWARLLAAILDSILLGVAGSFLGALFGGSASYVAPGELDAALFPVYGLSSLLGWTYFVVGDVKFGTTIGKKALGLRVQNLNTGSNLTVVEAILREVVGKFLSMIVFALGYLWMLWDPKKQTWHDKIAKSIVVKVK